MSVEDALESAVEKAITRFHREQQGVAPSLVRAAFTQNLVIVQCEDSFSANEKVLCETTEGRKLVQSARREQRALSRREAEDVVARIIGIPVLRSFWDLDVRVGDQMEVYVLARPFAR